MTEMLKVWSIVAVSRPGRWPKYRPEHLLQCEEHAVTVFRYYIRKVARIKIMCWTALISPGGDGQAVGWHAQTHASRPRDGAQGLRYVLKLDVSPTTREGPGQFVAVIPLRCEIRASPR
jgi:hypothetical protein